ncbi:MAG: hypothetical protein EBY15_11085 [Gammaproteobacteria bacterium]|nr:hypothetical protein [Gammaproteobacteria bacterium]NDG88472.1 hypothetical protein [Gammaproteobacteria bacterium]
MGNLHFFSNQGSWLNPMMKNPNETSDGLSREEIITRNGWAKTSPFVIPDDLDDVLGGLLRRLNTMPTWTNEKMTLYGEIEAEAKKLKYKLFKGDCRRYHIQRKGDHGLFDVPMDMRGALAPFRGKRIRLICAGSWDQYSGRYFLAKDLQPKKTASN